MKKLAIVAMLGLASVCEAHIQCKGTIWDLNSERAFTKELQDKDFEHGDYMGMPSYAYWNLENYKIVFAHQYYSHIPNNFSVSVDKYGVSATQDLVRGQVGTIQLNYDDIGGPKRLSISCMEN